MKPGPKPRQKDAAPASAPVKKIPRTPPAMLTGHASAEWRRIVPLLGDRVNQLDHAVLVAYCLVFARFVEAEAEIAESGLFVVTPNGYRGQAPAVPISGKALGLVHKLARELGLTPDARSKLPAAPEQDADADFFGS